MEFSNVFFSGTANDFVSKRVTLNGIEMDAVTVNALAKHGVLAQTGFGAKPARGRTPRVFSAVNREGFQFGIAVDPVVEQSTREFFAPETVVQAETVAESVQVSTETQTQTETVEPTVEAEPVDSSHFSSSDEDQKQSAILEALEAASNAGVQVNYDSEAPF